MHHFFIEERNIMKLEKVFLKIIMVLASSISYVYANESPEIWDLYKVLKIQTAFDGESLSEGELLINI